MNQRMLEPRGPLDLVHIWETEAQTEPLIQGHARGSGRIDLKLCFCVVVFLNPRVSLFPLSLSFSIRVIHIPWRKHDPLSILIVWLFLK